MTNNQTFLAGLVAAIVFTAGCSAPEPKRIELSQVVWETYTNPELHYTLKYPSVYQTVEYGQGSVAFKYKRNVPLLVRYTDEKEGRERGLWFGQMSDGEIELGGKKGQEYIYKHYDGPIYSTTIAYVIKYKAKYLALEFRTKYDLDEVQMYVLNSFKLEGKE